MYMNIENRNHMAKRKRYVVRGSVTVEASLSLFLFLMFFICIMYFYIILNLEVKIQAALEQTADMQAAYSAVKDYHDDDGSLAYIQCGLNQVFAKANVVRLVGAEYLDSTWIKDGSNGLHFGKSEFLKDDSTLKLVVSYRIKVPLFSVGDIAIVQNTHRRIWFGDDTSGLDTQNSIENMVLVTPNGVAYHLYADCDYIDVKLQAVNAAKVSSKRNQDGSKYYPCESCHPSGNEVVYITSYGNRYHCSQSCSAIEKDATPISVRDVGNRHLCSKCAKRRVG